MKEFVVLIILLSQLGLLFGCSKDMFQRTSYESLHIIEREKCLKEAYIDPEECYRKESYDDYQRQRKELLEDEQESLR